MHTNTATEEPQHGQHAKVQLQRGLCEYPLFHSYAHLIPLGGFKHRWNHVFNVAFVLVEK